MRLARQINIRFVESKHILLDCDGVLLNYVNGFRQFCEQFDIQADGPVPQTYNMSSWLGIDNEVLINLITRFNEESPRFGELEPYEHAVAGIKKLKEAGWTMSVLTSATSDPMRQWVRQQNLIRTFGHDTFSDIVVIGVTDDKESILRRYDPAIWVEDNYKNALSGFRAGHQPVMISHPHNAEARPGSEEAVLWSSGLDEIADAALEIEKRMGLAPAI